MAHARPVEPVHVAGTAKGEERALNNREPGRDSKGAHYRTSRDSTGINPEDRKPIDPRMPNIPPP